MPTHANQLEEIVFAAFDFSRIKMETSQSLAPIPYILKYVNGVPEALR